MSEELKLTREQVEMLRAGLLASEWCGHSKRKMVNALCDLALSALARPSASPSDSGNNQCDGCRRGLILDDSGIHRAPSGHPVMACTADRYAPPAVAAGVPDGWVMVPREPTEEIVAAIGQCIEWDEQMRARDIDDACIEIYRAMLSAAPTAGDKG